MAELVIRISGDIKNYEEALDKAEKETEGLSSALESVAVKSAIAFAALTAEIGLSVAAYKESEAVVNQLTNALQNQGIYSKQLSKEYQDQAEELQNLTGVSDEVIIKSQTTLQSFLGQKKVTQELTQAVLDFSAAKNMDAQSASEVFGKAIEGNVTALKKYGITIEENLTKQQRIDEIVKKVTGSFGGQAAAAAAGADGGIRKMTESFGNLQEQIGARFAPTIVAITGKMTEFFNFLQKNKALTDFIVSMITAGTVVTGAVAVVSGAGIVFLQLSAALKAAQVSVSLMTLGVRALVGATGLGLLVLLITEIALNWNSAWPKMQAVFVAFVENIKGLLGGLGTLLAGVFTGNVDRIIEGGKMMKEAFAKGFNEANAKFEMIDAKEMEEGQNEAQKNAADKREEQLQAHEDRMAEIRRTARELQALEFAQASEMLIEAKRQELEALKQLDDENYEGDKGIVQARLAEARARNSEEAAAAYAVKQEQLQQQKTANDTFLKEQIKFGTAYATINKIMHSAVIQGSAQAFGELAQLQQSSSNTLKSIGKVAAVANIIIKTAESAMNIYNGFSIIPIVGPALGIAGAAAAVAFGAEQIGKVNSAADGGLLEGGIPGVDSIPVMAMAGEMVVPRRNFDEVVDAVANQRAGVNPNEGQGGGGTVSVELTLKDELAEWIEAKINERTNLGISILRTVNS